MHPALEQGEKGLGAVDMHVAAHVLALAVVDNLVGALVGDSLMLFLVIRPFTTGPHLLHAPVAMTATFGALVAAGLTWAERKLPGGSPGT